MPVDEVATLRAAGLESAAKVIEAARAGQVAAQPPATLEAPVAAAAAPAVAPEIPAAAAVPAPVAEAAQQQGPQPPLGKVPLTVADLSTISQAEAVARMDEVEALERQEQNQRRAS